MKVSIKKFPPWGRGSFSAIFRQRDDPTVEVNDAAGKAVCLDWSGISSGNLFDVFVLLMACKEKAFPRCLF
jgi:hypothetical protein